MRYVSIRVAHGKQNHDTTMSAFSWLHHFWKVIFLPPVLPFGLSNLSLCLLSCLSSTLSLSFLISLSFLPSFLQSFFAFVFLKCIYICLLIRLYIFWFIQCIYTFFDASPIPHGLSRNAPSETSAACQAPKLKDGSLRTNESTSLWFSSHPYNVVITLVKFLR